MNKTAIARARVKQATMDRLEELAQREQVKVSEVIREALDNHIANNAPQCPACGSTDLGAPQDRFDAGHLVVAERKCADCGAIWEVD